MYLVKISNETIVNIENGVTYIWATRESGRSVRLILSSTLTEKDYRKLLKDDEAETLWNHLCSLATDLTQPAAQVEDETIKVGDMVEITCDLIWSKHDGMRIAFGDDDPISYTLEDGDIVKVEDVLKSDHRLLVFSKYDEEKYWIHSDWVKKVQS